MSLPRQSDRDMSARAVKECEGKTILHAKLSGGDWLAIYFADGTQINIDITHKDDGLANIRAWMVT